MIRINLLPVHQHRRRVEIQRQLQLAVVLMCLAIGGGIWLAHVQSQEIGMRVRELERLDTEIKALETIIADVKQFEKQSKMLQRKIDVIAELRDTQQRPAPFLDAISGSMPDQLWLTTIEEAGDKLRVSGKSFDNVGIAAFMENIARLPLFGTVELVESKSEMLQEQRILSFTITVHMNSQKKKRATT